MKFLAEYEKDEFTCPKCGKEDALSSNREPRLNGTVYTLEVDCVFCECDFEETYKSSGIKEIK